MLTVTPQAAELIRRLSAQAQLPAGAGLRIIGQQHTPGLRMDLAAVPREGDEVMVQSGVAVFLDDQATRRLQHDVLDARSNPAGQAFFLRP